MANVTGYRVIFGRNVGAISNQGLPARIGLYEGSKSIGAIYFYSAGVPIPEDRIGSNDQIYMHLPVAALQSVIDCLRNESPVTFNFLSGVNGARLDVGNEPVGEGELNP